MEKKLRIIETRPDRRRSLRELLPHKHYRVFIQGLGTCCIRAGDRTTVDEALIAAVRALGGSKTDVKAIKFSLIDARRIRAYRVSPKKAGFQQIG